MIDYWKNMSTESVDGEIWVPTFGYEQSYQISSFARIRSLHKRKNGEILKQGIGNHGYLRVNLNSNGKGYVKTVHRLFAIAFIPNPENLPCLNHKDGIKTHNSFNNIEWCTYSHNNFHAYRSLNKVHAFKGKTGINHHSSKKIKQLTLSGEFIKQWDSITEASKALDIEISNISSVAKNKKNNAGGFKWQYA